MAGLASTLVPLALARLREAVLIVDRELRVVFANQALLSLLGESGTVLGQPLTSVLHVIDEHGRHDLRLDWDSLQDADRLHQLNENAVIQRRRGDEFPFELTVTLLQVHAGENGGAGGEGLMLTLRDLFQLRSLADTVHFQRSHDELTGLVNRAEFERRLQDAILQLQLDPAPHTVAQIDLDQFKVVNDTCGHVAGDELLRQITELIRSHLEPRDVLARLGGDEFGILFWQNDVDEAMQKLETVRREASEFLFRWGEKSFTVSVSIGLVGLQRGQTWADVLGQVDAACFHAKEQGGNQIREFRSDDLLLAQRQSEMQWVSQIVQALQDDRFVLYAQPIVPVSAAAQAVCPHGHQEILLRLIDAQGNVVPPGVFLPAAERFNLILMLDRWVVSHTFSWLRREREAGRRPPTCGVNLSGTSLGQSGFLEFVLEQLASSAVPAEWLCFEVTETAAIANFSAARNFIARIRERGCHFALDDFGAGMSSFGYLKNLPADYLKIDGAFVRELPDSHVDAAMVRSINEVGKVMGMMTIAEFVENESILASLRDIGVDYAQGYGVGKPAPLEQK